jgi:hypothetical protein
MDSHQNQFLFALTRELDFLKSPMMAGTEQLFLTPRLKEAYGSNIYQ